MKTPIAGLAAKLPGIVFIIFLASIPAFPQQLISAKAGNIQFIEGEVFLNGITFQLKEGRQIQMENGQVLTTGKGYAELFLTPDVCLRLGEDASLRMLQSKLSDIHLELIQGSAIIEILKKLKTDPIRVNVSDSVVEMKKEGLYRLDAGSCKLRVYGGDARTIKGKKKVRVKNGRMVALDGELRPEEFDVDTSDSLHWWAAQRSFVLFAKNLFFTKPILAHGLTWRSRPEGIYNRYYRVTLKANEDWDRYWQGVSDVNWRRAMEDERIKEDLPSIMPPGRE